MDWNWVWINVVEGLKCLGILVLFAIGMGITVLPLAGGLGPGD